MSTNNDPVPIYCEIIRETDLAILIDAGTDEHVWLPKSQIEEDVSDLVGETAEITIPEWLADDKGLI